MDMKLFKKDSTLFLLPLIGISKNKIFTKNFITTYVRDYRFPEVDNVIILEYSKSTSELDELCYYCKIENKDSVLYFYELDTLYLEDYTNFLDGKYSKLSNEAKQAILKFWGSTKISLLYGILYKTNYAKILYLNSLQNRGIDATSKTNFEYWRIPSLSKETYRN